MDDDLCNFQIRLPRLPIDSPILVDILKNFYGIERAKGLLLTGYDDLNFKLDQCEMEEKGEWQIIGNNAHGEGSAQGALTLKFSNHWEARFYPQLCEAQIELSILLAQNGLKCPQLIAQRNQGRRHSLVQLAGGGGGNASHSPGGIPVRLYTFIPGQTLEEWLKADKSVRLTSPIVDQLAVEVGRLIGQFHGILDENTFCPPIFRQYSPLISLECWPLLRREFELQKESKLFDGNGGEEKAGMCAQIFDEFECHILTRREHFEQGLIHSDFNEANILLMANSRSPQICGLLDFGDCHHSFRLADLANAILYFYLLLREHFLDDSGQKLLERISKCIFSGYSRPLPPLNLSHLRLFLKARLVSSLVYGLRTLRMDNGEGVNGHGGHQPSPSPSMEYVLRTQQRGWTLLKELNGGVSRKNAIIP